MLSEEMKKNKRFEKIFNVFGFITTCIMLIIAVMSLMHKYGTQDRIESSYQEAIRLEEMGDYWNAYNAYLDAGDYNNADIKAEMLYPKAAMNYGTMLYYSDQKYNAIPYLIDAANADIEGAEELLMKLVEEYLLEKEE